MVTKLLPLEICSTSIMEKVYKHELLEKFISKKEITESLNRGMIKMAKRIQLNFLKINLSALFGMKKKKNGIFL